MSSANITPPPASERKTETRRRPKQQPRYNVRLWDDNDHTFSYVIEMVRQLFGHELATAKKMAETVDVDGSAILLTTTLEHAELKRDQVHAFGKDRRIAACSGSMSCSIEPVE